MTNLLPVILLIVLSFSVDAMSQNNTYTVTVDEPENGTVSISPQPSSENIYEEGTTITVTAVPEPGYVIDAVYYSIPGPWGAMYHDTPRASSIEVTVDQDMNVGAYFIDESMVQGYTVHSDIEYANPGVKPLKYDVYSPEGAVDLPVIVIIHGGGWATNDENIMRGMARHFVRGGKYVVASIDYRWIGTADGDSEPNTIVDLIEDVYGAIAHIQEHASEYGADPSRLLLTGDSAGGHLSASAATMINKVGDGGFGDREGIYEYSPTYIPEGKTANDLRTEFTTSILGVAPSYGVFEIGSDMQQMMGMNEPDEEELAAISPIHNIPDADAKSIPHYMVRGTNDMLVSDEMVTSYMNALVEHGHWVEYVQVGGAGHAFFDWKPNNETVETFEKYGVYYLEEMEQFFDSVLAN